LSVVGRRSPAPRADRGQAHPRSIRFAPTGRAAYRPRVTAANPTATRPEAAAPRMRRTLRIVLPAYEEAENLPSLLRAVQQTMEESGFAYEVIVVDDGSRDATAAIAEEWAAVLPLVLVRHAVNQGLGATLRDGLHTALARAGAADVVITMDADDTHVPGLIVRMMQMIGEGYEVVIASRYQPGARVYGVSLLRRAMSRAASLLMRTVVPMRGVRDFTCGYRAYRVDVLRRAAACYGGELVDQEGFQCMVDLLLKLRPLHPIIGEVPMLLRYDRKGGRSKMRVARTAGNTLLLLLRRRLGR
jgi:dolichol-phosphate mannosyltransferase